MPSKRRLLARAEVNALVGIQDKLVDVPGILPAARGMSHFGEHALGWLGLAAAGATVDANKRDQWVRLGVAAFTSHALSVVVKRIVRRRRPHDPRIKVGVATPSKLSFPSSHSTSTAAACDQLALMNNSTWPYLVLAAMMGSRMVLGVHYPTDTFVGAALGVGTSRVVHNSLRK